MNQAISSSAVYITQIFQQNMPSSRRTRTVETCDESGKERGGEGLSRFTRDPLSRKPAEQSNR